jgi:hypothetical protein
VASKTPPQPPASKAKVRTTQDPIPAKRAEAITIFDAQTSELISRIRPAAETIECAFHPFQPLLVAAFENHLLRRLRREVG